MTDLVRSLFVQDPANRNLPNDGVAKVRALAPVMTGDDAIVLHFELSTFVCEGHYEKGLTQILEAYLQNLSGASQKAVWVSGFFGSGKSHFVRVLEALWRNVALSPDGPRARDITKVSEDISIALRDLDKEAEREGGLWSASGMVTENREQTIKLTVLGILYASAGLSSDYGRAKFQLYLRRNGWEEGVRAHLLERGRTLEQEVWEYLASVELANAILSLTTGLGSTADAVLDRIGAQFAPKNDITDDAFLNDVRELLATVSTKPNTLPLTLIVLDEMQQYIGDNADRSQAVQRIVELLCAEFDSRIFVVATGQAALNDTPNLSKLQGRFTINVMLQDTDVESVVRKVVLEKTAAGRATVEQLIGKHAGEIGRHLNGSDLARRPQDSADAIADYPLLPTRRRFWEQVLRRTDRTGTAGQLRNQLRVVHQATRAIADQPVGAVIPGDMIFDQLRESLVQTGNLAREINRSISEQSDGTDDGLLRSRLMALIYLINKIRQDSSGGITSLRLEATADTLADLLVDDLATPSHELRARIPAVLEPLVIDGSLALGPNNAYAIQTGESLEWHQQFTSQIGATTPVRIAEVRDRLLRDQISEQLKTLKRTQGASAEARSFALHFGAEAPAEQGGNVPIWVRDDFGTSRGTVEADARASGTESPTIFVFVPAGSRRTDLNDRIRRVIAAEATIIWGAGRGGEGKTDAQSAMQSQLQRDQAMRDSIIQDILRDAIVYQGGGNEVTAGGLKETIQEAFNRSLDRLYTRFAEADNTQWSKVFDRAIEGNGDAMQRVGHAGEPTDHPVTRAIREFVGGAGVSWTDVRNHFKAPPFGWGQDAIDGGLAVLVGNRAIRVQRNGKDITLKEMKNKLQLAQVTFIGEEDVVSKQEYLKLRGLYQALGLSPNLDKGDSHLHELTPQALTRLREAANQAGGEPPAPLPVVPPWLTELENNGGNRQLKEIAALAETIRASWEEWTKRREAIDSRLPEWRRLEGFARHASGLPGIEPIQREIDAIRDARGLLQEPDPVPGLKQRVTSVLRQRITELRAAYTDQYQELEGALHGSELWARLREDERRDVLARSRFEPKSFPNITSDDQLRDVLANQSIDHLANLVQALPARYAEANTLAAKHVEPTTVEVALTRLMLRTEADVDQWIRATKDALLGHIRNGNPVVIK